MKKTRIVCYALFLLSGAAFAAEPALLSNSSGECLFPADGVIHPASGTVQMTVTPVCEPDRMRNEWNFAFYVPGERNRPESRTVLGLYRTPGLERFDGLSAVVRTVDGKRFGFADGETGIPANRPVNLALTWGRGRINFHINGVLRKSVSFQGSLQPTAPFFGVCRTRPFYATRLAVSTRVLTEDELQKDPARPFEAEPDTSLLANELDRPRYFVAPVFRNRISVTPFDLLAGRIFSVKDPLVLAFSAFNGTPSEQEFPVRIAIKAPDGKKHTLIRRVRLPANSANRKITLAIPPMEPGLYTISVESEPERKREFRISILPEIAGERGKLSGYLGAAHNRQPEVFGKLKLEWVRFWGAPELNWFQVEPRRGEFDFRTADMAVDSYRKQGVEILAVLGYPPLWAAEPPPRGEEFRKHKFQYNCPGRWKPRSGTEWSDYVAATVRHFNNRVKYYEIYNEADFKPPAMAATFSGSTKEYFDLLRSASGIIRKGNASNRVLITGFSMIPGPCDTKMPSDLLAMGAADLVDIWNIHSYRGLLDVPEMQKMVHEKKPGMPFWQTEQMWHILKDKARIRYMTAAINFWFLRQGFEKYMTFGWGEFLSDGHTMSPEDSLHAFAVCQRFLRVCDKEAGVIDSLPAADFDVRHLLKMSGKDNRFLSVIGSSVGEYQVRVANPDAVLYDLSGRRKSLSGGSFNTGKEIHFLVTKGKPILPESRLTGGTGLLGNPSFEELTGDLMGGLDGVHPGGWIFRTNYDPAGKIRLTDRNPRTGCYAVELTTGGKGRVYLFRYLKLNNPGTYRISAHFRNVSGKALPYLSAFDTAPGSRFLPVRMFPAAETKDGYVRCTMDITLEKAPKDSLAVIFGIDRQGGTVLLDDVEMSRIEPEKFPSAEAVPVPLRGTDAAGRFRNGNCHLSLDALGRLPKIRAYGGVPFRIGTSFAVAGNGWQGLKEQHRIDIPAGKYGEIHVLNCVMYAPETEGVAAGEIRLIYADGTSASLPLRIGRETSDWFSGNSTKKAPGSRVASLTMPDYTERNFFLGSYENPHPEKQVNAVEIRALGPSTVLAVPGLTLRKRGNVR